MFTLLLYNSKEKFYSQRFQDNHKGYISGATPTKVVQALSPLGSVRVVVRETNVIFGVY